MNWTILRPSLVYSVHGSYGGTSLLRAMAALPGVLCVPREGQQTLDPICAEDLGELVAALLQPDVSPGQILAAIGPQTLTLEQYLLLWRQWLGLPPPRRVLRVPRLCVVLVTQWGNGSARGRSAGRWTRCWRAAMSVVPAIWKP